MGVYAAVGWVKEKVRAVGRPPGRIKFLSVILVVNLAVFLVFRFVFWLMFHSSAPDAPTSDIAKALYLGFKFDLRLALMVVLPALFLGWIPRLDFMRSRVAAKVWLVYFVATASFFVFIYGVDFGWYEWEHTRLTAAVFEHLDADPLTALGVVWASYPVVWGLLGIAAFAFGYCWLLRKVVFRFTEDKQSLEGWRRTVVYSITIFLCLFGIYGKFSWFPLRWSEAYFTPNNFVSALGLNPVLYLMDTWKFSAQGFDERKTRRYYKAMAEFLGVDEPDEQKLSFSRWVEVKNGKVQGKPNVVLVFLESFGAIKVGAFGNGLDPTPHFDSLAREGILFKSFFVASKPTARSIFTVLTGIPDVNRPKSASRNPHLVKQRTLLNYLEDYEKMYFYTGSLNWGNIRGILAHNIPNIRLFEEGKYESPRNDVWGISDYHLFEEANRVFAEPRDKPFFAVIQTSGGHEPYTIPEDRGDFQLRDAEPDALRENGFRSLEEFNSTRFLDHSLGHFFELARKEEYFENTIFCIMADHGTPVAGDSPWEQLSLTRFYVPFLIYAPKLLKGGKVVEKVVSSVDVLPTILGILGVSYENRTLGKDMFAEDDKERYAFMNRLGILNKEFFLAVRPDGSCYLHRYRSDRPLEDVSDEYPDVFEKMKRMFKAFYETARYMLYHNGKD